MKFLKILALAIMMSVTIPTFAVPQGKSFSLMLKTKPSNLEPGEEEGNRRPGKPFQCTLDTEEGIVFIGQETPDFVLFEIYLSDTECVYASGDELGFVNHLFTLSGSYQICLTTTDGIVYAGYVDL